MLYPREYHSSSKKLAVLLVQIQVRPSVALAIQGQHQVQSPLPTGTDRLLGSRHTKRTCLQPTQAFSDLERADRSP